MNKSAKKQMTDGEFSCKLYVVDSLGLLDYTLQSIAKSALAQFSAADVACPWQQPLFLLRATRSTNPCQQHLPLCLRVHLNTEAISVNSLCGGQPTS